MPTVRPSSRYRPALPRCRRPGAANFSQPATASGRASAAPVPRQASAQPSATGQKRRREAGGQASGTHAGQARGSVAVQRRCALSFSAQTLLLASPGGVDALLSARANQRSILDIAQAAQSRLCHVLRLCYVDPLMTRPLLNDRRHTLQC